MTVLPDTVTPLKVPSPVPRAGSGVVRLMLTDFRNYPHLRLETDLRPVVLAGANGAGKTNILEALSLLTPGRGLRGSRLSEIGRRAPDESEGRAWAIAADIETAAGVVRVGTGIEAGAEERRAVHIDGKPVRGTAVLAEYFGAIWITPAMDRLFTDTPGERRKFIDRLVTALDAEHASRCAAYDQAYRRRTRLFRDGITDGAWYSALEDTLARYGVAVAAARRDAVMRLNEVLGSASGPFPAARLNLAGFVDDCLNGHAAVDAEDMLRAQMESSRQSWTVGNEPPVTPGPNRSDLEVAMLSNGRQASECSTGEQKALLISIILAHVSLRTQVRGQPPLLLLDEVVAHLDEARRQHLFDRVVESGVQAWLTGTDASVFEGLGDAARILNVANGAVTDIPATRFNTALSSHSTN